MTKYLIYLSEIDSVIYTYDIGIYELTYRSVTRNMFGEWEYCIELDDYI